MIYQQYPYNIYNPNYVNPDYLRQLDAQNNHWQQQKKIVDMVKAISDYCNAARDLEPMYQQQAMEACLAEISLQAEMDWQRNGGNWR